MTDPVQTPDREEETPEVTPELSVEHLDAAIGGLNFTRKVDKASPSLG